jgi:disulfide bond formation protein DsbB
MPRTAPLILLVLSIAVVGGALIAQYWAGLRPCELCLYERWPYYAAIALTAVVLVIGRRGISRTALILEGLIFIASAVLAFYHIGVEQHWFAGPTACTATTLKAGSVEALRQQLLATPTVRCDEIQWSVFGLDPLVDGNFLASVVLVAVSWGLSARLVKR